MGHMKTLSSAPELLTSCFTEWLHIPTSCIQGLPSLSLCILANTAVICFLIFVAIFCLFLNCCHLAR